MRLSPDNQARAGRPTARERGVALLMVVLMVALLGSVVGEFQFNSKVDLQLAINARDELQAEYNALSALRLRALLLRHNNKLKQAIGGVCQMTGMTNCDQLPITQVLDMVPVECGIMSAVIHASESPFNDPSDVLAGGGEEGGEEGGDEGGDEVDAIFPGDCIATSTSEHGKIPLMELHRSAPMRLLLMALLSDPRLERHFQEDDRNGSHAENPEELVNAIIDWVDADDSQYGSFGDEGRHYDLLRDSYEVRNAPFDSLAELRLIHGVDDEMYNILKGKVSIYSDSNEIDPTALDTWALATLTPFLGMRQGANVDIDSLVKGIAQLGVMLEEYSAMTMGMSMIDEKTLVGLVQASPLAAMIDVAALQRNLADRPKTTWFTIEAQGRVGNANRRIRAVFQAIEGRFWYMRIE